VTAKGLTEPWLFPFNPNWLTNPVKTAVPISVVRTVAQPPKTHIPVTMGLRGNPMRHDFTRQHLLFLGGFLKNII
jgi:hypothetical protein